MSVRSTDSERTHEPPAWEPEPLQLPLEVPRAPERRNIQDEGTAEREPCVVVIDLV
jgi:hypothetical protein